MQHIVDQLQEVLQADAAGILVLLGLFLLLFGASYAVLLWRQRRCDLLAYLNRGFYERVEQLVKGFVFLGEHRAEFFGRTSCVRSKSRLYGLCTIPPPGVADEECRFRYAEFSRAIQHRPLPLFAPCIGKHTEEALVVIQGGFLQHNGQPLQRLSLYLKDRRLGKASSEDLLLQLAMALAQLHTLKTEEGIPLYHGMLLPRVIFIESDFNHVIQRIIVADLGMAFALGAEQVALQITQLKKGTLPMDRLVANSLLEELPMLAPEQQEGDRVDEVGQPADFYTFGALAVELFTQQPFKGRESVDWEKVPPKWHRFIRACLNDSVTERPSDFAEVNDWLTDPTIKFALAKERPFQELSGMLQRTQQSSSGGGKREQLAQGMEALECGRFEEAREVLLQAHAQDATHAEVLVGLAVCYYELGDLDHAEKYYLLANERDPEAARTFREHIAFRV